MFPWLTFLAFPEPNHVKRARVYTTDHVKGDLVHKIQVLRNIPWLQGSSSTVSQVSNEHKASIRSLNSPVPSSKSPRPCPSPHSSSGSNSQPTSAREKPLFAPPPEPKQSRNQRKGMETSSAMLELFGGNAPSPFAQKKDEVKPRKEKENVHPTGEDTQTTSQQVQKTAEKDAKSAETAPIASSSSLTRATAPVDPEMKAFGANSCFQEIRHPEDNKHYGRRNLLEKDGYEKREYEEIKMHPSTSSAFQTIEDHDAKYEESLRRSKWEHSTAHFNIVPSNDLLAQPGPEKFEDDEEDQSCPAENVLNDPESLENMRCNLQNKNSVVVSEEFISEDAERKPRTTSSEKDKQQQIQLNNPGPELPADEDTASEKEMPADGQEVVMDAMDGNIESMCCKDKANESIIPAGPKAEPALSRVFESTNAAIAVLGTIVAVSGRPGTCNYSVNKNGNQSAAGSNKKGAAGSGRETGKDQKMVSLTAGSGGADAASNGSGGGDKPILIRGGQIVNDDSIVTADILIEDGIIKQVSPSLTAPENAEIIEAAGRLVLPAGIDAHTEFSTTGTVDDFTVGTKAAIAGGTTTVIDVVIPRPEDTLTSAFERCRQQAHQRAVCNVGLSVVVQKWSETVRSEMETLVREKGVNSFILDLFSDSELFAAFEHAKELGAHVRILPENRDLAALLEKRVIKAGITGPEGYNQSRPAQLEADRIQHVSNVAQITNCPITVLSVTSSEASRAVHQARRDGALITAEVPITAIIGPNHSQPNILTRIPLREGNNHTNDALELLANGPLSMCVSDHSAPPPSTGTTFARISKGATGVEERLTVLWEKAVTNGRIDPMRFVAITSSNPAKTFNLYPQKGRIGAGADADVVVWDIKASKKLSAKNHLSKADQSIFEGINVRAQPTATICAGKVLFKDGKHVGAIPGMGAVLELKPNSPFVFSVVHLRENMNSFNLNSSAAVTHASPKQQDERPVTSTGTRNKNSQSDQHQQPETKPRTKVIHPPGGKSSGFW